MPSVMRYLSSFAVMLAIGTGFQCIAVAFVHHRILNSQEIQEKIIGSTVYITGIRSNKLFATYYDPNGKAYVRAKDFVDAGLWKIEPDNSLCTKWKIMRKGKWRCYSVRLIKNKIWYFDAETEHATARSGRIVKGNPEGF